MMNQTLINSICYGQMVQNEKYWIQEFDELKPHAAPGQAHGRIIELNMRIEFYMKLSKMKFSRSLVWASSNRAHALLARRCQTIARNSPGQAQGQICSTGPMNGNGQHKQWHHNLVSFVDMAFNLNHIFYIF